MPMALKFISSDERYVHCREGLPVLLQKKLNFFSFS